MPKFVVKNKPSAVNMKQVMMLLIVVLVAFTLFYAFKIFSMKAWGAEKFTEEDSWKVVLIYSDGCPHCVRFKPTFDAVASQKDSLFAGKKIEFVKIPAAEAGAYADHASEGIPATLVEKNGVVVPTASMVGNMKEDVFVAKLKEVVV